MASLHERFMAKVLVNPDNGCWEWQAGKNHRGQGIIRPARGYRGYAAPRVSLCLFRGMRLDAPEYVLRTCSTSGCVNPDHLKMSRPPRKDYRSL